MSADQMRVKGILLANAADRCSAVRRPAVSDLRHMRSRPSGRIEFIRKNWVRFADLPLSPGWRLSKAHTGPATVLVDAQVDLHVKIALPRSPQGKIGFVLAKACHRHPSHRNRRDDRRRLVSA